MSEQTKPEDLLLKTYLREAVEALRERARGQFCLAYDLRRQAPAAFCGLSVEEVERAEDKTRAALRYFKRLASVEVDVSEHPGVVVFQVPYEDDGFSRAYGQRVELLSSGEWCIGRQPPEYGDAGGVAHLAAALECRRRNEVGR